MRLISFFAGLLFSTVAATAGHGAETFVLLYCRAQPETLTVNEGDTVTFTGGNCFSPGFTESYTGEWRSPILLPGQTFSYTFNQPGRYVWRALSPSLDAYYPGVIDVRPVEGNPPAIWISRPLDNFQVSGYTDVEAATTNTPESVVAIYFYADAQLVGMATNPPYVVTLVTNSGTFNVRASVVNTAGRTNTSAAIRLTFGFPWLFQPWRLPQGQTACFVDEHLRPWCIQWSEDLKVWNRIRLSGQVWGNSIMVDETTTNVMQRFYFVQNCL